MVCTIYVMYVDSIMLLFEFIYMFNIKGPTEVYEYQRKYIIKFIVKKYIYNDIHDYILMILYTKTIILRPN